MDVLTYLLELLKSRKEVGMANLGTFIKQKTPGKYDQAKQAFLPPSFSFAFTNEIKEKDALVDFIARKNNVSTDEATDLIDQFVNKINKGLEDKNSFLLAGLGELNRQNGQLNLIPTSSPLVGLDFYALPIVADEKIIHTNQPAEFPPPIETPEQPENELEPLANSKKEAADLETPTAGNFIAPPLTATTDSAEEEVFDEIAEAPTTVEQTFGTDTGQHVVQDSISHLHKIETIVPEVEKLSNEIADIPSTEQDPNIVYTDTFKTQQPTTEESANSQPKEKSSVFLKTILVIAIATIILFVVYFIKPSLFTNDKKTSGNNEQTTALPVDTSQNLPQQSNSLSVADTIKKAGIADSAITRKDTATAKSASRFTYEVIVAALTSKEVQPFINRLKKKGINANVVFDAPGRLKKISVASFNNPDSARKYAEHYRKRLKDQSIYAIPIKH